MKLRQLRNNGIVIEGAVLAGGELETPKGIKTHYLRVRFQKENNEDVTKDFPVDRDDYQRAAQSGRISITYVPGKSDLSRVGAYYGYNRTPLYAAIIGFLFSSAAILVTQYLYGKDKKARKLTAEGLQVV
jgi:hypothetical protein